MANDVYQLNIVGNAESQYWESVLHFQSGTANASQPLTVASHLVAAFIASVQTAFRACLGEDANVVGYRARRVNNTGGPQHLHPITPVPGTYGDDCTVSSIGGVILAYYTQGTKTRSGRWFLPALPKTAYDNGVYDALYATNTDALITAINGTITSSGDSFNFGVWARKTKVFFPPTLVMRSAHLGTQRRRLLPVM